MTKKERRSIQHANRKQKHLHNSKYSNIIGGYGSPVKDLTFYNAYFYGGDEDNILLK